MKPKKITSTRPSKHVHVAEDVAGVAAAVTVGSVVGAVAGPPGMLAGGVIGAAVGAIAAVGLEIDSARKEARTRTLDEEIGVTGGALGAPNLQHPPAVRGTYSAGAAGAVSASGEDPAEGPMQTPGE